MSEEIQRRVIHVADAVIAGQGNGPLNPQIMFLKLAVVTPVVS